MRRFVIEREGENRYIEAHYFTVEDGVLIFHKGPRSGDATSLGAFVDQPDNKSAFAAYSDWVEVEVVADDIEPEDL